jgi:hypothetical protein
MDQAAEFCTANADGAPARRGLSCSKQKGLVRFQEQSGIAALELRSEATERSDFGAQSVIAEQELAPACLAQLLSRGPLPRPNRVARDGKLLGPRELEANAADGLVIGMAVVLERCDERELAARKRENRVAQPIDVVRDPAVG